MILNDFIEILQKGNRCVGDPGRGKDILAVLPGLNFFTISPSVFPKVNEPIDLNVCPPFKTCWLQLASLPAGYEYSGVFQNERNGVFIHELAPYRYLLGQMIPGDSPTSIGIGIMELKTTDPDWRNLAVWLQPFKRSIASGLEKTNIRLKYKLGGEKHLLKIKKVVYILPKKAKAEKAELDAKHTIDWSHRWFVRGHWRRIAGIGKNRAGEYCVGGFTYVLEHEKGKEHVAPIRKTRVIPLPLFNENANDSSSSQLNFS